jgi:hypothetical protein
MRPAACRPAQCGLPSGGVASGGLDSAVRVVDEPTLAATPMELRGHDATDRPAPGGVLAVAYTAEGLVSAARDGRVLVWGPAAALVAGQPPARELRGHGATGVTNSQNVSCVAACGDLICSGGWDKTARVWGPASDGAAAARAVVAHAFAVNAVCALPGSVVATGCGDGGVRLFDAATGAPAAGAAGVAVRDCGQPVRALCSVPGYGGGVGLAAVSNDGFLRVWGSRDGFADCAAAACGGDGYLFAVAADEAHVVVGGDDGVVTVFDHGLRALQRLALPGEVFALAALAGPRRGDFACGCGDGRVHVVTRDSARAAAAGEAAAFAAAVGDVRAAAARALALGGSAGPPPAAATGAEATPTLVLAPPPGAPGPWDFSFPVDLGAGEALTIAWRRGESPEAVAERFCREHGLPAAHVPDIVAFVLLASQQVGAAAGARAAPAAAALAAPSASRQAELVAQVAALGVGDADARAALEATGWAGVELAVAFIYGT